MKKTIYMAIVAIFTLSLAACGTMKPGASSSQPTTDSANSQSLLGSLLSGLIGNNTTVTPENIAGTWKYSSPDCRFTSENALSQAGGAVAANEVESKLANVYAKVGITPTNCSFTFNKDNTCQMVLGGRTINGTYTLDTENRQINIRSTTGLISMNAKIYYSYSTLTLLFDANKLLSMVQMVAAFTGQGSSTIATLSSLLSQYDGMMIGMNLTK